MAPRSLFFHGVLWPTPMTDFIHKWQSGAFRPWSTIAIVIMWWLWLCVLVMYCWHKFVPRDSWYDENQK